MMRHIARYIHQTPERAPIAIPELIGAGHPVRRLAPRLRRRGVRSAPIPGVDLPAARTGALQRDLIAPALSPKTWYGIPAYAKDGKVVCFFQSAQKFKSRYATFGFSDEANLDEGALWPTSFALKELTTAEEAKIGALVKKAVS